MKRTAESTILNSSQAAKLLGLHAKTVVRMAREERLPATKVLGRWRFMRGSLEDWLAGQSVLGPATDAGGATERTTLSARNQLRGVVERIAMDGLMAEVSVRLEAGTLVSVITRASAERLGLRPHKLVTAVIKATEVLIGTDSQ